MKTEIRKWYHDNGNIGSETPYKNGKRHGIRKYYYDNGNVHYETPYKNDVKNGIEKVYGRKKK